MKSLRLLFRILQINLTLARYGLDRAIKTLHLLAPLRFLIYLDPRTWFRRHNYPLEVAVRLALEDLGPIFVKFGQALSIRRDLLPNELANELTKLQDKVAGFDGDVAKKIVEDAFATNIDNIFASFDIEPLASASIAQVHAATLLNGTDVVVKILRPNVEKRIKRDLELLYTLAKLADRYWREADRVHPIDIVREFEKTLHDECDLQREAANASQLKRNAEKSKLVYIPTVYWDHITRNVMVMERVYGIPVNDIAALRHHKINIKKLAERGVEIFFTQVFRDNFFHADMHPGNIFVSPNDPENPTYICVDFGIIGSLDEKDKRYLAENFHAFFNQDYQRVAELHVESGWVPHDTSITEFESAIRTVCEPIFERPLRDISMAQMLMRLFRIGRRFRMEVQIQLLLLQKTLFAIEGLGRQLYPDLDLWHTAKPFIEDWMHQQSSPRTFMRNMIKHGPTWFEKLPELPMLMQDIAEQHKLAYQKNEQQEYMLELAAKAKRRAKRRYFASSAAIVFAGAACSQLPSLMMHVRHFLQQPAAITTLFVLSGLSLSYAFINRD